MNYRGRIKFKGPIKYLSPKINDFLKKTVMSVR